VTDMKTVPRPYVKARQPFRVFAAVLSQALSTPPHQHLGTPTNDLRALYLYASNPILQLLSRPILQETQHLPLRSAGTRTPIHHTAPGSNPQDETMATDSLDQPLSASQASYPPDTESLTPLEQEVLDEYARLLGNMNNVRAPLSRCSSASSPATAPANAGVCY
jgi:hypothetical protein